MKLRNKKTGEIKDVESIGHAESLKKDFGYQVTLSWNVMNHLDTCRTYKTLAELNEEWEDYKPAEPLIKDEKTRKAVRAWAEACEIESDDAIMITGLAPAFTRFYTSMYEIDIKTESSLGLDERKDYTIAELCGEEEE